MRSGQELKPPDRHDPQITPAMRERHFLPKHRRKRCSNESPFTIQNAADAADRLRLLKQPSSTLPGAAASL